MTAHALAKKLLEMPDLHVLSPKHDEFGTLSNVHDVDVTIAREDRDGYMEECNNGEPGKHYVLLELKD